MDKLQGWLERIQLPPRQYVANLDYWELLAETRMDPQAAWLARPNAPERTPPHRHLVPAPRLAWCDAEPLDACALPPRRSGQCHRHMA